MDTADEEVVVVTWWTFMMWWLVFLLVHLVTCGYNAVYALFYWELEQTTLCWYLGFYHVGMAPEDYRIIAVVHAVMCSIHAVCVLLMVGSSLWLWTLAFTPWGGSCVIGHDGTRRASGRPELNMIQGTDTSRRSSSFIRSSVSKLAFQLTDRYGLLGVNGKYFHIIHTCRELIETSFQTIQAYRMSFLLPNMLLNRFYVVGLVLNCWSSAIIYVLPFGKNETRRRFASLASDCALDLLSCMGVTCIIVLSYINQYDTETTDFPRGIWYNDEWVAHALNEFQMILVVSWSDLFSRALFSLGLVVTTTNLKELLYRSARHRNRVVVAASTKSMPPKQVKVKPPLHQSSTLRQTIGEDPHPVPVVYGKSSLTYTRLHRVALVWMHSVHLIFLLWGLVVLGLHIQASVQPGLPQCVLQVRTWAVSRPSCFFLCLDCYQLGISGFVDEVDSNWREFDGSTVAILLIKHCPLLDVPDVFNEFHQLISIKVYNSTILAWKDSAAITNSNHPGFLALMLARVNMTDGLLPAGLQSSDTPYNLYDFEFCVTNLRAVPDDLDTKWNAGSMVFMEYSQLEEVPPAVLRIMPYYLSLVGSPISELPHEIFEIEGMTDLAIGYTNIHELPERVTQLSTTLTTIYMHETNVSYFWSWADQLINSDNSRWMSRPLLAGGSAYCDDLERISSGPADVFHALPSPQYSVHLMDPANAINGGSIWSWVDCSPAISGQTAPLFALAAEDERNALSF
ncbi:Centrosomal protein of 41 kDa [Phytophthora pseudosyringae]|uniref:Centrosomal protein of 41 kDa n=1 Tax=Phytophthora pseudosyringae TaxID=221518 RepID=A0A8T1V4N2_9STRA|nr:Centrosomal protein of 41 kDa [Phytophthora pseudosyringae]